ncbi:DNA repair protein complementing XP-G cells homolog [Chanos chanos]|uniref:DNA repair protein complementing XP-G cells homolog n=1 Tax=Chanos chanos TaxID=29144 RepID=A0A6J2VS15_CHACN|nr:DNA repair protein complementing XP-G cells [Chanos chanos]
MGVHGLWKLLESTGKPINPETLEGKILAVDISIWLNQAVKGVRDRDGNSVQNAHLLTLFNRLCKLLFFRIKPIFVFDGDAPLLKKQTLAIRRQRKEEITRESQQTNEKLLRTFLKRQAIKAALGDRSQETIPSISSVRQEEADDIYALPALPPAEERERNSSDEDAEREWEETVQNRNRFQEEIYEDPNAVDINSEEFSLMPPEVKHEILKEMKDFNKRRRTLYHKPPEKSGDFSQYQLAGLLQRNRLNQRLEDVEQEMSQRSSGVLEQQPDQDKGHSVESRRLVSEDSSHYILIKGPQNNKNTSESQVAATPWSSGPWARQKRAKGRPEPLWRPIAEDSAEENELSSSSSSSTTPKPAPSGEDQHGAPPSPRTLKAIQAAMTDSSSSDEEVASIKRRVKVGDRAKDFHDEGGGDVSPRTLQAIQSALMEDDVVPKEVHQKDRVKPQKNLVVISSSDEEDSREERLDKEVKKEEEEADGGLSPQTLLAIQNALTKGEGLLKDRFQPQEEQVDLRSSSEKERMEEFVGARSKASSSAIPSDDATQILGSAPDTGYPSSDQESDKELEPVLRSKPPLVDSSSLRKGLEMTRVSLNPVTDGQKISTGEQTEEKNGQIVIKSEESEESSSEESFIEVSEAEDESGSDDSHTKVDAVPAQSASPHADRTEEEEETKGDDSIGESISQDNSEVEEKGTGSSQGSDAAAASNEWDDIDMEELVQLESSLQAQQSNLRGQQQQQERSAATVTGQMCLESQELLRLFGIPFMVAPMEAEAQCAALDRTDQTHGTITDDSDIWLFGGRHVYKNFFSHNKYVEHYQYVDLQNQLTLDRTKLINLAYLLGSDYTEGIPGVGYVTGMEILNEFPGPGLEPLQQFSEWWEEAQKNKKLVANPKDTKVKKKLRHLQLHSGFPNPAVAQAYLHPAIDQSEASFSWGRPQLELIKEFCLSRFGWNSRKTEETLQPVLKQLNSHQTQLRIDSFFRLEQQERQAIRSQRLRRVVTCLKRKEREGGDEEEEDEEEETGQISPVKKSKTTGPKENKEGPAAPTFAGAYGGGFIGSQPMNTNSLEALKEETGEEVGGVMEEKRVLTRKNKPKSNNSSSSSSSSEDEGVQTKGVAMVTARSIFEGKTRGRGKRGGRGGRGRSKKSQ